MNAYRPAPRLRRTGDGLVLALIGVGIFAMLGGFYVGAKRPRPKYPKVDQASVGPRQ